MIPSKLLREKPAILRALRITVKDLQRTIERDMDELHDGEIDIRLCVDGECEWIIRTGDVSYDPYHSEYCAATLVVLDTNPDELVDELLNDILDQQGERHDEK